MRLVAVSGGFDFLHVGHLRMMQGAAILGKLLVILNTDEWLMRKKGYVLMPWRDRAELIRALNMRPVVIKADDEDGTVCATLRAIKPHVFVNSGDRKKTPEESLCREIGIETVYFDFDTDHIHSSTAVKSACQVIK